MRSGSVQSQYTKKALLSKSLSCLSRTVASLLRGSEPQERGGEASLGLGQPEEGLQSIHALPRTTLVTRLVLFPQLSSPTLPFF